MFRAALIGTTFLMMISSPALAENSPYESLPKPLLVQLRENLFIEQYIAQVLQPIRQYGDKGRSLSKEQIEKAQAQAESNQRASQVSQTLQADMDGDGKVTEAEARAFVARQNRFDGGEGNDKAIEEALTRFMRLDTNKDGTIDYEEMRKLDPQNGFTRNNFTQMKELLALDPNKDAMLTATELETLARKVFATIDTNNDGYISRDEMAPVRAWINGQSRPGVNPMQSTAACDIPKPGKDDTIVLYGAYEGYQISPVAAGGRDTETTASTLEIESGRAPIYLVLSSFDSMIWQIEGAKDRIAHVTVLSQRTSDTQENAAGITGIPKSKVTFVRPGDCFGYFYKKDSIEGAQAAAATKQALGRELDATLGNYKSTRVALPSGKELTATTPAPSSTSTTTPSGFDAKTWPEAVRYYPGGLADIKAEQVVSAGKAEPYDVLPNQAGVAQLIGQGALVAMTHGDYKIIKPIARYPAALTGAHSVRFLLGKGVPAPKGNPGHSCVISEDTGKPLEGNSNCR